MVLRRNDLTVGQTVSLDQYVSSTPGRLPHTKGQELTAMQFTGGTLFVDHCTKFMIIYNQVYLDAGETLVTKQTFESMVLLFQNIMAIKCIPARLLNIELAQF